MSADTFWMIATFMVLGVGIYLFVRLRNYERAMLSKFDHDGDGRPGGSLPKGK